MIPEELYFPAYYAKLVNTIRMQIIRDTTKIEPDMNFEKVSLEKWLEDHNAREDKAYNILVEYAGIVCAASITMAGTVSILTIRPINGNCVIDRVAGQSMVLHFKQSPLFNYTEGAEGKRTFRWFRHWFKCEDGLPVYEGINITVLDTESWSIGFCGAPRYPEPGPRNQYKYFSSKEKADQYVIENKPMLSYNEIWDTGEELQLASTPLINHKAIDKRKLLDLIKNKLKL